MSAQLNHETRAEIHSFLLGLTCSQIASALSAHAKWEHNNNWQVPALQSLAKVQQIYTRKVFWRQKLVIKKRQGGAPMHWRDEDNKNAPQSNTHPFLASCIPDQEFMKLIPTRHSFSHEGCSEKKRSQKRYHLQLRTGSNRNLWCEWHQIKTHQLRPVLLC